MCRPFAFSAFLRTQIGFFLSPVPSNMNAFKSIGRISEPSLYGFIRKSYSNEAFIFLEVLKR